MPRIEVSVIIKGSKDKVYGVIKGMEDFPSFMRDVKGLKIIKRLNENRILSAWEAEINGAALSWQEEDCFDDTNYQVKFNMVSGNYKAYQGRWLIDSHPKGTRLTLEADFDWGIPILEKYVGGVLEKKAQQGLLGILYAIKNRVEKS